MTSQTFLFTDLESSTKLWERHPEAMHAALARHDAILRAGVADNGGTLVKTTGDGLMAVFTRPRDAVAAGLQIQHALQDEPWGEPGSLKVRIGVHVGESTPREGDYYGPEVNRAARVMAAGHGGQILVSHQVAALVGDILPQGVVLRDLGPQRLKDLALPEQLFQIVEPGLPDVFPPLITLDLRPNNLPSQASVFLGREADLAGLRNLIDNEDSRLITLTGPGGTGKTRLALQAAADQIDRFEDGVFFVDLAMDRDADSAFATVARTVGSKEASEDEPLATLKRDLAEHKMLLVLDNFEQITVAATGVSELIAACPSVDVLVTSREALRVRGERLFPVPPLSLPNSMNGSAVSFDAISGSEAVQLFIERGAAVRPEFALSHKNADTIAAICVRLDGLPLALELAAARLRLFSPDDLLVRLESRLDFLRGGARDLPDRQQTLRNTIEWSTELLNEEERLLLQLFSVFSGARFEAVEHVAGVVAEGRDLDVIDGLESLVDKSLIRRIDVTDGTTRFTMLQTIREHAAEQLAVDPERTASFTSAHAEYYADLAGRLRPDLVGSSRHDALSELVADLDNLTSAWHYWLTEADLAQLNTLLDTLWELHDANGWYGGVIELASDLLAVLSQQPETPERVRDEIAIQMSLARAMMAIRGYTAEVEDRFNQALELTEGAGGVPQRFPVLRSLASLYVLRSEYDKGAAVGRELLDLAEEQDDPALEAEAEFVYGANLVLLNDIRTGLGHLDRAIELFDPNQLRSERFRLGPSPGVVSLTTSAFVEWWLGLPEQAKDRGARALRLATDLKHPTSIAYANYHVALLALWRQDIASVAERGAALMQVANANDYPIWRSLATILLGLCRITAGDTREGLEQLDHGAEVYESLKAPPAFTAGVLSLRATGYALAGRFEEAIGFLSQSFAEPETGINPFRDPTPFSATGQVMHGDLLLAVHPEQPAQAEEAYVSALKIAQELDVLMPQLQARIRLAKLKQGTPNEGDAVRALLDTYDRFTEGFAEVDLIAARSILAT